MSEKTLSQRVFEETADGTPDNWHEIQSKLMSTHEELLQELKDTVWEEFIHHPLLVTHAMPIAYNNYLFRSNRRKVERAEERGDWFEYVFTHARPFQFEAFTGVADRMDDVSYWRILASVYIDSENIRQHRGAIRRLLTSDRPCREALMDEEERVVLSGLPETVTVFRGYGFGHSMGWSWTISREKAEWFANRFGEAMEGTPRVATGEVKKSDIIAYFDGREEKEIVCDPESVANVTTERLDGKQDTPRVPRQDRLDFGYLSDLLRMHMGQKPTLTLAEMSSALELMYEEMDTLMDHHGGETLCADIDLRSIDSPLLRNELQEMGDSGMGDVHACIEEAIQDILELIEEHGRETLCGDFDLS